MASLKNNIFSDIDLSFRANPVTDDISIKRDNDSIKQSIQIRLLKRNSEYLFENSKTKSIEMFLGEPLDGLTALNIKKFIETKLQQEKRIKIKSIDVQVNGVDYEGYFVRIVYTILVFNEDFTFNFTLKREA